MIIIITVVVFVKLFSYVYYCKQSDFLSMMFTILTDSISMQFERPLLMARHLLHAKHLVSRTDDGDDYDDDEEGKACDLNSKVLS